jgi:hypothetical protein
MLGRAKMDRAGAMSVRTERLPFWRRLWFGGAERTPSDAPSDTRASPEPRLARGGRPLREQGGAWRVAAAPAGAGGTLRDAFTPRQPKRWRDQFVGRAREIDRAITAIADEQAHVVLFGDRGRGKTSLANVLAEALGERGYLVIRCSGSAETQFETLFRQSLQRVPADRLDRRASAGEPLATLLPPIGFGAAEVAEFARQLARGRVVMIIDEFDRIADPTVRTRVADTIKSLSDARSRLHLLIVGVAGSLEGLLGAHPSIERNVVGIHVPLMDAGEIETLVAGGAAAAGITFEDAVTEAIVGFSQGLPYCAQLFSLYAGRRALQRGSAVVSWPDFRDAAAAVLDEMAASVGPAFERAAGMQGQAGNSAAEWLSQLARADADAHGVMRESAVAASLDADTDDERQLALDWLRGGEGRQVLQLASGAGGPGFVFANSLMRQYILLRDFAESGAMPGRAGVALPASSPERDLG